MSTFYFEDTLIPIREVISIAATFDESTYRRLLDILTEAYHNDSELVPDSTYDALLEQYETRFRDREYSPVGAVPRGNKVTLPYYLGSLRKVKTETELKTWSKRFPGPYLIEDKVDGLTLLYVQIGSDRKLYTRGTGSVGQDVTPVLPYLNIPISPEDVAIRGEVVMYTADFERNRDRGANPRAVVSGTINAKTLRPALLRHFHFLAFRVVSSNQYPDEQIVWLQQTGYETPEVVASESLDITMLTDYLSERKATAPYDIDGLVIYSNQNLEYPVGENPRHVIAFKTSTETVPTVVTDVIWESSKNRLLKPVVHFQPVVVSGATLSKASGDNARFIINSGLGPGAKITVTRSGDVIPRIVAILERVEPSLPDPEIIGAYQWNETGVELVLDEDSPETIMARMLAFVKILGVPNLGPARVRNLYTGGIDSIPKLISVTSDQLRGIPGIGSGLAESISASIRERIPRMTLPEWIHASGFFPSFGTRKAEAIVESFPNLMTIDLETLRVGIGSMRGFSSKTAYTFVTALPLFREWYRHLHLPDPSPSRSPGVARPNRPDPRGYDLPSPARSPGLRPIPGLELDEPDEIPQDLVGKIFVFSGFRSSDLKTRIEQRGGRVSENVTRRDRDITTVIAKDPSNRTGKLVTADKYGVQVVSLDDFEATLN